MEFWRGAEPQNCVDLEVAALLFRREGRHCSVSRICCQTFIGDEEWGRTHTSVSNLTVSERAELSRIHFSFNSVQRPIQSWSQCPHSISFASFAQESKNQKIGRVIGRSVLCWISLHAKTQHTGLLVVWSSPRLKWSHICYPQERGRGINSFQDCKYMLIIELFIQ